MTAQDFIDWRERLGFNRTDAAEALGLGRNQPQRYEEGQPIPKYIALACAALAHGLPPIGEPPLPAGLPSSRTRHYP